MVPNWNEGMKIFMAVAKKNPNQVFCFVFFFFLNEGSESRIKSHSVF